MASQARNFSFDPEDERALPSTQHHYQPYHDSIPQRDIISPLLSTAPLLPRSPYLRAEHITGRLTIPAVTV